MSKKVYLHIGAGKTGSSALQVWLHNNATSFLTEGYYYPTDNQHALSRYQITSGNGLALYDQVVDRTAEDLIARDLDQSPKALIYSSEGLQKLRPQEILYLKNTVASAGATLIPIIFIRDIYPIVFSSYQQLIKRHLYTQDFGVYVNSLTGIQQFEVLEKFELFFEEIKVLHYDSLLTKGLDIGFLDATELNQKNIPKMSSAKVNRGLTTSESELLKIFNKAYLNNFEPVVGRGPLADALIYRNPEAVTEFLYDEELHKILNNKFSPVIEKINNKYFLSNLLQVCDTSTIKNAVSKKYRSIKSDDIYLIFDFLLKQASEIKMMEK